MKQVPTLRNSLLDAVTPNFQSKSTNFFPLIDETSSLVCIFPAEAFHFWQNICVWDSLTFILRRSDSICITLKFFRIIAETGKDSLFSTSDVLIVIMPRKLDTLFHFGLMVHVLPVPWAEKFDIFYNHWFDSNHNKGERWITNCELTLNIILTISDNQKYFWHVL